MNISMMLLAAAIASPGPTGGAYREAIVVGSNHPLPGSGYDVLRYADDDALRFASFFDELAIPTALFTVPDPETIERFGDRARSAVPPTRAAIETELGRLRARFAAAEGRARELYFVFSGHGSVTASRAYLHLFDGPFTRTDLFEQVLRGFPAERIHVIIDSCHSYFLVNGRGERTVADTDREDLDRYPNAGFLLSTSDRREVQEWDGYRAGVFSYQVLGALRGAADVDRDGVVTYPEVHAYVLAANQAVTNPTARIRPFVRRPKLHGDELVDLGDRTRTVVGRRFAGHFFVVDDARGRLLDAHKPADAELALMLPEGRSLQLKNRGASFLVRTSTTTGRAELVEAPEHAALVAKGSPADEFRMNLFKVPLSIDFVRGIDAVTRDLATPRVTLERAPAWYENPWTVTLLASGTAAIVLGGIATAVFVDARDTANGTLVRGTDESEIEFNARIVGQDEARGRAGTWQGVMIAGYAAGAALVAGGLVHAWTGRDGEEAAFAVTPRLDGGAEVTFGGRF